MPITVLLPRALSPYADGARKVEIVQPCAEVSDALRIVALEWPALIDRVLTEQGQLRKHVNVFVGDENIRFLRGLGTGLSENDVVTIVPAVSGG